ncbi:MAG TPA: large conductance mechanosensitive channel protein MscL [Ilumatobacteraceae bacterium]|nr:large conductance mechanosensitive channel protein MscL [Ilumatobacteraceae bacterium]
MKKFVKEFRDFIATGNMVEIAVAFILGAAVKQLIDAFTNGIMMQLVAAIVGKPDFSELTFTLGDAPIYYGTLLTQAINLVLVGFALFLMVKAYNAMRRKPKEAAPDAPTAEVVTELSLLMEIRDALKSKG